MAPRNNNSSIFALLLSLPPIYVVVAQIRSRIAGFPPPFPLLTVSCAVVFYRDKTRALSSLVHSRRIYLEPTQTQFNLSRY